MQTAIRFVVLVWAMAVATGCAGAVNAQPSEPSCSVLVRVASSGPSGFATYNVPLQGVACTVCTTAPGEAHGDTLPLCTVCRTDVGDLPLGPSPSTAYDVNGACTTDAPDGSTHSGTLATGS
jgi:hypothetical protein